MPGLIGAIFPCPEMLNFKASAWNVVRLARNISFHVLLNDALNWINELLFR